MRERVWQAFGQLSTREQRLVSAGGAIALVLLVLAVLLPLQRGVTAGSQRIERERSDLSWLQTVAPQLGALSSTTPAPLRESLVVLVDRTARDAGVGRSLVGSQPGTRGTLTVRFEQAPFDQLVSWLSDLGERYDVHALTATIDAGKMPGMVNATLELRAGR